MSVNYIISLTYRHGSEVSDIDGVSDRSGGLVGHTGGASGRELGATVYEQFGLLDVRSGPTAWRRCSSGSRRADYAATVAV